MGLFHCMVSVFLYQNVFHPYPSSRYFILGEMKKHFKANVISTPPYYADVDSNGDGDPLVAAIYFE